MKVLYTWIIQFVLILLFFGETAVTAQTVITTAGTSNYFIPATGVYTFTLVGADGGDAFGGNPNGVGGSGATMSASFFLTAGDQLRIFVGSPGQDATGDSRSGGGGAGGTAVILNGTTVLIAAGGGGGGSRGALGGGGRANTNPTPAGGLAPYGAGGGGFGFAGANSVSSTCPGIGGGAGTLTTISAGGQGFNQGCSGGGRGGAGFGGGGGQTPQGGGGGGGYAGGNGTTTTFGNPSSFGGDSYIHSSGTIITTTAGVDGGSGGDNTAGTVTVTPEIVTCLPASTPTVGASLTTVCSGATTTLSVTSGDLNANTSWNWFSGSCGGTPVGTGASINVSPGVTTTYYVRGEGSCSASGSCGSITITVSEGPATPTITAGSSTTFCSGESVVLTSSVSANGYQWLLNGSDISGAVNQNFTATATGNYSVVVFNSSGCSATSATTAVLVNALPATPTISAGGATTFCSGGSVIFTSSASAGYQWLLNGSVIPGANSQTFTATAGGNYSVRVSNPAGCEATSATASVTLNPSPVTPSISANGSTDFCSGGSVVLSSESANGYQWTLNSSAINGANNQTYIATSTGNYAVTVSNEFGCTASSAPTAVTVNPLPAVPVVSVTHPTCAVSTGAIEFDSPLTSGNTFSIGGAYQSSTAFAGVNPGDYTVSVQNSFGCIADATTTINPVPFVPAAPVVTGATNVCSFVGTGTQITYTAEAAGASSYNWTIPPTNVNIISGQGTGTLTVTFSSGLPAQANKQIRVTASSVCGTGPMSILQTLTQTPNTPNPISGLTKVCSLIGTGNTASYSIPLVLAASEYTWTVPAGTVATHPNGTGINDTIINLQFLPSFTGGMITVRAVNNCGVSSARSLTIGFTPPATPGLINGSSNACEYMLPGGTAATYSVGSVASATAYNWTVPSGAVVTHPNGTGANDNTITVTYPSGFVSGTITVSASNGCGTSSVRSLSIVKLNPATPSVPDVIQTGFCGDVSGRVFSYTIASLPLNATSVNWIVPASQGATLVSGQGTTSIVVSYPSTAIDGSISLQGISNCGTSLMRTIKVKIPACAPTFTKGNAADNIESGKLIRLNTETGLAINVFPNPTIADFSIQVLTATNEQIKVSILDMAGREIKRLTVNSNQLTSIGAELKAGTYILKAVYGKEIRTTKIIKL